MLKLVQNFKNYKNIILHQLVTIKMEKSTKENNNTKELENADSESVSQSSLSKAKLIKDTSLASLEKNNS